MASAPSTPKIVALVPMKHTSVRVRGKNYRMFQGQPLCYWVLKTLRACPRIDQIVIDTDSEEIKEMLARDFPPVESPAKNSDVRIPPIVLLDRPAELLDDPPMNEILMHDTSVFPADFYLQVRRCVPCSCPLARGSWVRCPMLHHSPQSREPLAHTCAAVQTHSTNPFLKVETVNAAIEDFLSQYPHFCDSLFSVTQRQVRAAPALMPFSRNQKQRID